MIYFFQALSLRVRFFALLLLLFPVLAFQWLLTSAPWAMARLQVFSNGAGVPDQGFWYSAQQLQDLFTAWGPQGREVYAFVLWPTDLGFLVSYGLLLCAATLYLLKKSNPAGSLWYLLPLLPLTAAGFDLLENLAVGLALVLQPERWEAVSWLAAAFTSGKWVFFVGSVLLLFLGSLVHLLRRARDRHRAAFPKIQPPAGGDPGLN